MEKREFNKVTKEILLDYGFVKKGNKFYLFTKDVTIEMYFASWRGVKYFGYAFSVNALDHLTDPPRSILERRYDCLCEFKLTHSPHLEGYHSHEILYEEYTEEEYRALLTKTIHIAFDPFKEDALNHMKSIHHVTNTLSKNAAAYLGIDP